MEGSRQSSRRWRIIGVLALGVAIGTSVMATSAGAHVGGTVAHLWDHLKPLADVRYANAVGGTDKAKDADKLDGIDAANLLPGGILPSGTTIRGNFEIDADADGFASVASNAISFGYVLPSAPVPHTIQVGAAPPPECPGSAATPQALPGHLCIYETFEQNERNSGLFYPNTLNTTRYGSGLYTQSAAAGFFVARGTWAVTAP